MATEFRCPECGGTHFGTSNRGNIVGRPGSWIREPERWTYHCGAPDCRWMGSHEECHPPVSKAGSDADEDHG